MNVVTVPAHLATLAVNGVVSVLTVGEMPTTECRACGGSGQVPVASVPIRWRVVCEPCLRCTDGRVPLVLNDTPIAIAADDTLPFDVPDADEWGDAAEFAFTVRHHGEDAPTEYPLHPGHIVGSARATTVPIVEVGSGHGTVGLYVARTPNHALLLRNDDLPIQSRDLSDHLAYGLTFRPGDTALILTDAKPCEQRCPTCWGTRKVILTDTGEEASCWTCFKLSQESLSTPLGTCPPIPYTASETWSVL